MYVENTKHLYQINAKKMQERQHKWMPNTSTQAPSRVQNSFKLLTLTYKCLDGIGPEYLHNLLVENKPNRQGLWSQKLSHLLVIPCIKHKTFAARSFSITTPVLWNALPDELRQIDNLFSFKSQLKTHLFKIALNL